jgi:hypothetical protein
MPELLIRTMTGKSVNIIDNFDNVEDLKSKIHKYVGTPPYKQALLYNGKLINDSMLSHFNSMKTKIILYLVLNQIGG